MISIVAPLLYGSLLISGVYSQTLGRPTSTRTTRASSTRPGGATPTPSPIVVKKNPKRGISWAAESPGDIQNFNQTNSVISWQYDWANIPPAFLATSNVKYIPMQWGSGSIDRFVDSVRAQGADTILGFNEPDFYNEANMDPTDAARLWIQYIQPLKQYGVRLGGPAVTAGDTGRPWLQKFFAACSQCTVDFLPLHWYGSGTAGFYDYLWTIRNQFPNTSVWITEYADTSDDPAAVLTFMNETMRYLDGLDWVERYAWFGLFRPRSGVYYNLLNEDGGLNALGELYVGAKTVHTQILSDTAYSGYRTVNGADLPNQPLVTSWPAYTAANAGLGRPKAIGIFGGGHKVGIICFIGIAVGVLIMVSLL